MPPNLVALKFDEAAVLGLRLMRSFLKLRSRARREELIALAERLVEQESEYPAEPRD
jgi:hypothetical protein